MFSTERLILRASRPSDDPVLLELYNHEKVGQWITEGYLIPRHHNFIENIHKFIISCVMSCVIEEKETGTFVGLCSFVGPMEPKNRNAVICIALHPDHWSKGYGYEAMDFMIDYAFESMNMHRVSLTVFEGNDRALELYRRLGFVEEGRHRKIVWMRGSWRDTFYMGILEEEWAERKKSKSVAGSAKVKDSSSTGS